MNSDRLEFTIVGINNTHDFTKPEPNQNPIKTQSKPNQNPIKTIRYVRPLHKGLIIAHQLCKL
jgi:hypothetical protein